MILQNGPRSYSQSSHSRILIALEILERRFCTRAPAAAAACTFCEFGPAWALLVW